MNPSKTAIIVDSGCDVSKQLIQKYDMKQLSLKVIYPEKMYMDGEDIKPQMVYERFPAEIPSTSMANIQDVLDLVDGIREQGYENVYLWALDENERARKFYEGQDFLWNGDKNIVGIMGKSLVNLRYIKKLAKK